MGERDMDRQRHGETETEAAAETEAEAEDIYSNPTVDRTIIMIGLQGK